ncbi:choice-of-anchor K domain-containing protein [Opitutus terrae]|uniref:PEP-CTERM protein-sorting domain-containing protein n=1 Tax=Opitutus terrae (strain DSM 11246 / JCM 15787 / PB90-1) TaxID=452637 RepID=B1ZRH2_OPITP|nr:choice-of-anchor K domain-containing protein [Opitutus terrae]ACB77622.1 hypothetical protein Oter_4350 [Opitutus terrae PB90-1]
MLNRIRATSALALGLVLTAAAANAQLLLSGHTTGSFQDLSEANTTVTNAGDGSSATFQTGIATTGSTQSRIEFQNATFSDVGSGEPIQVGLFNITNGVTELGSGAPTAQFNLGLELNSPEMQQLVLSTITFHIDHTPNRPGAVPDTFAVTFNQPAPVKIQNTLVQFHVNVDPSEFPIAENGTIQKGDITVTFTPVPEPSTYAACGAALLVGLIGYRRFRATRSPVAV